MGDENPICTLGDYSKPSYEGYRDTLELLVGNSMVPLQSDTIWLVQNGCSFYELRFEDPNQHLKDFLKLVDSLDLDGDPSPHGRILLLISLLNFFPPGRTTKLCNDILMFQQHHEESLSKAWTRFKDLLQKVPHHGIDLWLKVQIFYDHVNPATRQTIDQSAGALPQDVLSTFDRHLINLENQVQRLMEAHLAPMQPTQVNKVTTSCETYSGPHDTQYCMEDPEQAFVENASSRTNEAIDPQCSTHVHGSINAITICPKQPNEPQNDESEEKERGREGNPKDTNTMAHNEEQRDTPQLELKDTFAINNLGPNRNDDGIEWLDVEEPLALVDTNGIKEITFKTPYKDPKNSELSSEGRDLLSSRVILSEDDSDRGCRKPSDLENGFYRDIIKLGPEYLDGIDDEGEVT
uniref:Zinc finger, CCHC-type n=1 Tax=Tanacetum cinerariifolium TaxID=118510 RepID=A0A6L2M284_TANCI|nr:zinc finger, CCHC-type [Tanacetum cinerariifolium]